MFLSYQGKTPHVGEGVFVDESARVIGDVILHDGVTVMPGAIIRADVSPIEIGAGSVVEDGCVLHVDEGGMRIGDRVTLGHGAIVHGTEIGSDSLVGMGAIVLSGAVVGIGCLVAAGALVTQGSTIPDGCLAIGVPARVRGEVSEEQRAYIASAASFYQRWGAACLTGELREVRPEPL